MSSVISTPEALADYRGAVQIEFKYNDVCIHTRQACQPIHVPECPIEPLILLQQIDNGGKENGPVWMYNGKEWETYHPSIHNIPKSESDSLVDAGTDVSDVFVASHSPSVEILRAENAPTSDVDPEVEDDLDEDEDEATADQSIF